MSLHDLPWSSEQREWLQALGHDVFVLATTQMEMQAQPMRDGAAPAPEVKVAAAPASLLRALARAAGRNEQDAELLQTLPELASLRGNPAARRALWPRLRALRKRSSR